MVRPVTPLYALALLAALSFAETVELKQFPTDSLDQVSPRTGVKLDRAATVDSNGSIAIRAKKPQTYQILDAGDIDIEEATLVFRAKMKTLRVSGSVFLEVVCVIPGLGRMSLQGLQYSLSGTNHWIDVEVRYPLRKGENPDSVKLNLVFDGDGKAWVDDVRLYREDLPEEPVQ